MWLFISDGAIQDKIRVTEWSGVRWCARRAALEQLCLEEWFEVSLFVGITPSIDYYPIPHSPFTGSTLKLSQ